MLMVSKSKTNPATTHEKMRSDAAAEFGGRRRRVNQEERLKLENWKKKVW
jgi:hypothetical protein